MRLPGLFGRLSNLKEQACSIHLLCRLLIGNLLQFCGFCLTFLWECFTGHRKIRTKISRYVYNFNFQLLPIPSQSTLTKFTHLKSKYRVSQNGFVEKIPTPELFRVGPEVAAEDGQSAAHQNGPLVHLKFVSDESPEDDVEEANDDSSLSE